MSQSFNSDAFKATFSILFRDNTNAIPHFQVKTIDEISPERLWEQGVRAVIFDKDNTLTAPYVNEIYPELQSVVARFKTVFGNNMKILSNSAGTKDDKGYRDAVEIEEKLGIPVIRHDKKKPLATECVAEQFECSPEEIVMVGDRLLTDTLFGNLAGLLTIHSGILTTRGDNRPAMIARNWENSLLRKWIRKGATPPPHSLQNISLK